MGREGKHYQPLAGTLPSGRKQKSSGSVGPTGEFPFTHFTYILCAAQLPYSEANRTGAKDGVQCAPAEGSQRQAGAGLVQR